MSKILDEINKVLTERENNYDHPRPNFERIADYWSVLFRDQVNDLILRIQGCTTMDEVLALVDGFEFQVTPEQVSMAMMLMKIAREQHQHKHDNLVDIVGYAVCQEKIVESKQEEEDARSRNSAIYQYILTGKYPAGGSGVPQSANGRDHSGQ